MADQQQQATSEVSQLSPTPTTGLLGMRIGVVGGGPSGLTTAISLNRQGFKNVIVYERDAAAESRFQGYSFTLFSPNGGLAYLERLGLLPELESIAFEPKSFRFADSETGESLVVFSKQESKLDIQSSRRVMRAGLRDMLVRVAQREGVKIVWNSRILKCEQPPGSDKVLVSFEGESEPQQFDLIIGADGAHSVVRRDLIGDELLYTGYTSFMCMLKRSECPPEIFSNPWFDQAGVMAMGRGITFFAYHHPPDEIFCGITMEVPKGAFDHFGGDKVKLKQELVRRTQGMIPTIRTVVEKSDFLHLLEFYDRTPLKIASASKRIANRSDSRITLMGDAAHLMVPFRAMGGNNALLDSMSLVDKLGDLLKKESSQQQKGLFEVLSNYEQEVISRTTTEVLGSRQAMFSVHSKNPYAIFFRDRVAFALLNWKMNVYPKSTWQPVVFKLAAGGIAVGIAELVYRRATGGNSLADRIPELLKAAGNRLRTGSSQ